METVACPDFDCFQYLIVEDMLAHLYKKEEADKLRILVISNTQIENRVI
jgi:hypothetical protein